MESIWTEKYRANIIVFMFIHQIRAIVILAALFHGNCEASTIGLSYPTQRVAGILVINTPIIQDGEAFAMKHSAYPIYKHVMRSWLYGALMINANETLSDSIDLEVRAVATLLHGLGWDTTEASPIISADRRFDCRSYQKASQWTFSGSAYGVSGEDYAAIAKAFPKSDFKDSVDDTMVWLCDTKPQTTYCA
jgi:hypothetical protein